MNKTRHTFTDMPIIMEIPSDINEYRKTGDKRCINRRKQPILVASFPSYIDKAFFARFISLLSSFCKLYAG